MKVNKFISGQLEKVFTLGLPFAFDLEQ